MLAFKEILESREFNPLLVSEKNHYRIYISSRRTIKRFSDWIYNNKCLYLRRKFEILAKEKLDAELLQDKNSKTPTRQRIFLNEFKIYGCVKTSCNHVGISLETYEKWLKMDLKFNESIKKIKDQ
ncbi:hypothetical protein [Bacillus taeanensis]|uniref:hypothetical protein n=1 Tax=Bacillus taeanensis TaxID=273032 RepID=UPI001FE2AFC7|nr:hypothetical protein [Bacillus taeanensis]